MNTPSFTALLVSFLIITGNGYCQPAGTTEVPVPENKQGLSEPKKTMNFFIVSKRKKGKLDLATRYNVLRSKLKAFFGKKRLVAIVARDTRHACAKISQRLRSNHARIGTLWFDSHGMYKKGYSLFFIGSDEISYRGLQDSALVFTLEQLSPYADTGTRLVIGSCYGGATYQRSSIDYKDTTRMNGDSLMMAIGRIIRNGKVYASESWVMTKPGLFRKRAAVGGFPGRKLFRDSCYQPAWENMGLWNQYDAGAGRFAPSNPVALDRYGNLVVRGIPFVHEKAFKKSYHKKSNRLQSNLYK